MKECKGCIKLEEWECWIPFNSNCPCKLCILKGSCTLICKERQNLYSDFKTEIERGDFVAERMDLYHWVKGDI